MGLDQQLNQMHSLKSVNEMNAQELLLNKRDLQLYQAGANAYTTMLPGIKS